MVPWIFKSSQLSKNLGPFMIGEQSGVVFYTWTRTTTEEPLRVVHFLRSCLFVKVCKVILSMFEFILKPT